MFEALINREPYKNLIRFYGHPYIGMKVDSLETDHLFTDSIYVID